MISSSADHGRMEGVPLNFEGKSLPTARMQMTLVSCEDTPEFVAEAKSLFDTFGRATGLIVN